MTGRGGETLPHYVSLVKWTDKGVQDVKDSPKRLADLGAMAAKLGAKLTIYSTMGEYDFVAIAEGPSDEIAMQIALQLEKAGNARTVTMKAWTLEESAKVIAKLQ